MLSVCICCTHLFKSTLVHWTWEALPNSLKVTSDREILCMFLPKPSETCADTRGLCHPGEQQTWQIYHWFSGLFTDDSRFTQSSRDRYQRVWRLCGEWFGACNSFQCARFGDGLLRLRHICRGLCRCQRASLERDHQTYGWCSGVLVDVARLHNFWIMKELLLLTYVARSLQRPFWWYMMPTSWSKSILKRGNSRSISIISTAAVYGWHILSSLLYGPLKCQQIKRS